MIRRNILLVLLILSLISCQSKKAAHLNTVLGSAERAVFNIMVGKNGLNEKKLKCVIDGDFKCALQMVDEEEQAFNKIINNINAAEKELDTLKAAYEKLKDQKNKGLEAAQVAVQINASEAWIQYKKGNHEKALALMKAAADAEDATEKHPVTPGPVIPARELLGELLLEMDRPALALPEFEKDLERHPNRHNGLIGQAMAKEKAKK